MRQLGSRFLTYTSPRQLYSHLKNLGLHKCDVIDLLFKNKVITSREELYNKTLLKICEKYQEEITDAVSEVVLWAAIDDIR